MLDWGITCPDYGEERPGAWPDGVGSLKKIAFDMLRTRHRAVVCTLPVVLVRSVLVDDAFMTMPSASCRYVCTGHKCFQGFVRKH